MVSWKALWVVPTLFLFANAAVADVAEPVDRTRENLIDLGFVAATVSLSAVNAARISEGKVSRLWSVAGLLAGTGAFVYGLDGAENEGWVAAAGGVSMAVGILGLSRFGGRRDGALDLTTGVRPTPTGRLGSSIGLRLMF